MDSLINMYFETTIPISACNLYCEYCYVIQQNRRNKLANEIVFDIDKFDKSINAERLGGTAFFNLCGSGETLLFGQIVEIVDVLLSNGHVVNVTTNGTITKRVDDILSLPSEKLENLMFSFSFHYIELKNKNLLRDFSENVKKVLKSPCSCFVQICLCDSYIDCLDEITKFCENEFGTLPHATVARKEEKNKYSIYSERDDESFYAAGEKLNSELFDYTFNYFMKKIDSFCYAGAFSYKFDLMTGDLKRCYFTHPFYNIYKDKGKIPRIPIGKNCELAYCVNSSHFISQGIVPEIQSKTYVQLRNREGIHWIKDTIYRKLNGQLPCLEYKRNLLSELKQHSIVLYGAGNAAEQLYSQLKVVGVSGISKVVVSKINDQDLFFHDIHVCEYSDSVIDENDILIVSTMSLEENIKIRNQINHKRCYLYQEIIFLFNT